MVSETPLHFHPILVHDCITFWLTLAISLQGNFH